MQNNWEIPQNVFLEICQLAFLIAVLRKTSLKKVRNTLVRRPPPEKGKRKIDKAAGINAAVSQNIFALLKILFHQGNFISSNCLSYILTFTRVVNRSVKKSCLSYLVPGLATDSILFSLLLSLICGL